MAKFRNLENFHEIITNNGPCLTKSERIDYGRPDKREATKQQKNLCLLYTVQTTVLCQKLEHISREKNQRKSRQKQKRIS